MSKQRKTIRIDMTDGQSEELHKFWDRHGAIGWAMLCQPCFSDERIVFAITTPKEALAIAKILKLKLVKR